VELGFSTIISDYNLHCFLGSSKPMYLWEHQQNMTSAESVVVASNPDDVHLRFVKRPSVI
jgi:hypothetical protein